MKEEERSRYTRPSVVEINDADYFDAFTKGGFFNKKHFGILGALEETTEKKVINIKKTISLYKSDLSFFIEFTM